MNVTVSENDYVSLHRVSPTVVLPYHLKTDAEKRIFLRNRR